MADKKNLLLLFENPTEPVFLPKGKDRKVFQVPRSFLTDRYQEFQDVRPINTANKIVVKDIVLPNLEKFNGLKRSDQFSISLPSHCRMAAELIQMFMEPKSVDDLQSVAVYVRDRINAVLFNYALSVALLHRSDTKDLILPTFVQTFPHRFIDSNVLCKLKEESFVIKPGSRRFVRIPRDYTANDLDLEHRLHYFREDMGINLHHWHWHLVYPIQAMDIKIVDKDRRGELFYYMHQQIIARYNLERFSNNLPRVEPLNNLRKPIPEGYFPKMDIMVASRSYPPRLDNTLLTDIKRIVTIDELQISDLELWINRILDAIHQKFIFDKNGKRIELDDFSGIDILGNMIEASQLSPNRDYFGNLHNMGHNLIALAHDPTGKHLEPMGVMGENSTAMRDPIFYRWHAFIDDIFQQHKKLLSPYTDDLLKFDNINIDSFNVRSGSHLPSELYTYWEESDLDLSLGIDFQPEGSLPGRFTHLQHQPFTYTINVSNISNQPKMGTVRIFLAPQHDERGYPMDIRHQRLMMVELDKFVYTLNPGWNTITRQSTESNVTIPYKRTFGNVRESNDSRDNLEHNFCNCGWPQHMLIPKGLSNGLKCVLFVMISDNEVDKINREPAGNCGANASYCGARDQLYPDRRSMGYPFDRPLQQSAYDLKTFVDKFQNMKKLDISIKYEDRTLLQRR